MLGSVINQGVGNVTGSQIGFSWSSVAVAGIGAGVGASISKQLGLIDALEENCGQTTIKYWYPYGYWLAEHNSFLAIR